MTNKKNLIPLKPTPEVILTRPKPPARITKNGLVQLAKIPEISGDDITVLGAVDLAVEVLTEQADESKLLTLKSVLIWLDYVRKTSEFISQEEG